MRIYLDAVNESKKKVKEQLQNIEPTLAKQESIPLLHRKKGLFLESKTFDIYRTNEKTFLMH